MIDNGPGPGKPPYDRKKLVRAHALQIYGELDKDPKYKDLDEDSLGRIALDQAESLVGKREAQAAPPPTPGAMETTGRAFVSGAGHAVGNLVSLGGRIHPVKQFIDEALKPVDSGLDEAAAAHPWIEPAAETAGEFLGGAKAFGQVGKLAEGGLGLASKMSPVAARALDLVRRLGSSAAGKIMPQAGAEAVGEALPANLAAGAAYPYLTNEDPSAGNVASSTGMAALFSLMPGLAAARGAAKPDVTAASTAPPAAAPEAPIEHSPSLADLGLQSQHPDEGYPLIGPSQLTPHGPPPLSGAANQFEVERGAPVNQRGGQETGANIGEQGPSYFAAGLTPDQELLADEIARRQPQAANQRIDPLQYAAKPGEPQNLVDVLSSIAGRPQQPPQAPPPPTTTAPAGVGGPPPAAPVAQGGQAQAARPFRSKRGAKRR